MNNLNELWDKCLDILKVDMNNVSFETYIKGIRPLKLEGDKLSLQLESETQYALIKMRYEPVIKAALIKSSGREIDLDLIMPGGGQGSDFLKEDNGVVIHLTNGLNKYYTFENFVVGENSRMAFSACLGVAELPGQLHNPLFIYSAPGLGKTHLMHAIGNFIKNSDPKAKIIYVTSEAFTNEFITQIQLKKPMQEFRDKYRNCDALLIDDIQFLAKKKETQEEFFHTFNDLVNNGAQIVISSDRPPREIRDLEERLYSRFSMGLMADISAPELETRIAILKRKIYEEAMVVPEDVIYYIADTITSNVRELEGSIKRVAAFSKLKNCEIDLALTKEAFKGLYEDDKKKAITPERIKAEVCDYMNITLEDLEGTRRSRNIVVPRQIAQYLIRMMTNLSYPLIAEQFSVKDHTTIMHNCDKIETAMKTDESMRNTIKDLTSIINR